MLVVSVVIGLEMQGFGATLKFDPHFYLWDNSNHFFVKWVNSNHFGVVLSLNVYGMYWHVVL